MKRVIIKPDRLGRICSIYYAVDPDKKETEEFKDTLNFFRGQQLTEVKKYEVIDYLKLSLATQEGSIDAMEQIENIHKSWNEKS